MYNETKSAALSGSVIIENTVVVNMYAQKSTEGDVQMNINIQSPTIYEAYRGECDENIATFKKHVEEL